MKGELICRHCRFPVEADDIAERTPSGVIICVRCWKTAVHDEKPMPHDLAAQVERAMGKD